MSNSTIPVTINGAAGGTIYDQAGLVVIELATAAATVVASLGTDTVLGGDDTLLVVATGNTHPLQVQPGFGAATIYGGGGDITIVGTDGSEFISFTGLAGYSYRTTTDPLTNVCRVILPHRHLPEQPAPAARAEASRTTLGSCRSAACVGTRG